MSLNKHRLLSGLYKIPIPLRFILKLVIIFVLFLLTISFIPASLLFFLIYLLSNRDIVMKLTTCYSYVIWMLMVVLVYLTVPVRLKISMDEKKKEKIKLNINSESKCEFDGKGNLIVSNDKSFTTNLNKNIDLDSSINNLENLDLPKILGKKPCLVVANHHCSADFVCHTLIAMLSSCHKDLKYLLKKSLVLIPVIGYSLWFLQFCFLARSAKSDEDKIKKYLKKMKGKIYWLVLYPEGTRFTKEKKVMSDKYCIEKGMQVYENLLCPRKKGMKLIKENINNDYGHVVDVTSFFYKIEEEKNDFQVNIPESKRETEYTSKNVHETKHHTEQGIPNSESGVSKHKLISPPSFSEFIFFFPDYELFIDCLIRDIEEIKNDNFLDQSFRRKDKIIGKWRREGWN